jgi:hypothetical protein
MAYSAAGLALSREKSEPAEEIEQHNRSTDMILE